MPNPTLMRILVILGALAAACGPGQPPLSTADSARRAFGDTAAALALDTHLFELRGQLYVKIPNPDRDDESPLADRAVPHPANPGPHTMNGTLYAELGALRALLGTGLEVRVDTARDHVFVGSPPVLLVGHRHGEAMYVPVKLYARQFGAFTDISCTFANCGFVWPRDVIDHMRAIGATGGAGILEGHAEGIVHGIDVTRLPTG